MVPRQRQSASPKGGVTAKNERKARKKKIVAGRMWKKRKQPEERATRSVNKVGKVFERGMKKERRRSNRCSFRVVCLFSFLFPFPSRSLFQAQKERKNPKVG